MATPFLRTATGEFSRSGEVALGTVLAGLVVLRVPRRLSREKFATVALMLIIFGMFVLLPYVLCLNTTLATAAMQGLLGSIEETLLWVCATVAMKSECFIGMFAWTSSCSSARAPQGPTQLRRVRQLQRKQVACEREQVKLQSSVEPRMGSEVVCEKWSFEDKRSADSDAGDIQQELYGVEESAPAASSNGEGSGYLAVSMVQTPACRPPTEAAASVRTGGTGVGSGDRDPEAGQPPFQEGPGAGEVVVAALPPLDFVLYSALLTECISMQGNERVEREQILLEMLRQSRPHYVDAA